MSQENVEIVRRAVKDVHFFWTLLDEYVVWDLRQIAVAVDIDPVHVGREAVIKASRHYWGTWEDYELDAEEIVEAGPSVALAVHERGLGRGSGAPFERRFAQVWTFQLDRIVRWAVFEDMTQALEAVGLTE